ncbi:MAG: hypothetical protein IPF70_15720 [Saprospiraceae bacterium]|jgi:predicted lysophospholipase L1 biosynthesis ABC-type transport system permease subunit|nr:hypothetical protein [Saprospiraceae bacterium]MBK7437362.1 hypothetical protein [Saprospiraceae bacterium]MBK8776254.1 hypothetical protein [Saprospiraceae bacterium]
MITEIRARFIKSLDNKYTTDDMLAPNTFLIQISLEQLSTLKVARLNNKIKKAMIENNLTYPILPPACTPFSFCPCRYPMEYGL